MRLQRLVVTTCFLAFALIGEAVAFVISAESSCRGPDVYSYHFSETAILPDYNVKVSETAMLPDLTINLVSSPRLADLILVDADLLGTVDPDMRMCSSASALSGVVIKVTDSALLPDIAVKLSETAYLSDYSLFVRSEQLSNEQAAALFAVIWEKNRRANEK